MRFQNDEIFDRFLTGKLLKKTLSGRKISAHRKVIYVCQKYCRKHGISRLNVKNTWSLKMGSNDLYLNLDKIISD